MRRSLQSGSLQRGPLYWARIGFVLSSAALALSACGVEFDPASRLATLRVVAMGADQPSPLPGTAVKLDALLHDGTKAAPRALQVGWLWGCYNPLGDTYLFCAVQFAERAQTLLGAGAAAGGAAGASGTGAGGSASVELPECSATNALGLQEGFCKTSLSASDAKASSMTFKVPAADAKMAPSTFVRPATDGSADYGLSTVFFAACAGKLELALESGNFPPFQCRSETTGELLGSDDFVIGYYNLYSYRPGVLKNTNPKISGFVFDGREVAPDCIGDACLKANSTPETPDCASTDAVCVAACADDGKDTCPEILMRPALDESIRERDQLAALKGRTEQEETIWVRYLSSAGAFSPDVKLVNAATAPHWNPAYEGRFRAPKQSGPMFVWAIVQDSRGGASWVRKTVLVR